MLRQQREVFLEGNAFFIVRKKEDKKKFIVHSKSLGGYRSWNGVQRNTRNAATEVGLISGKVKVDAITPIGRSICFLATRSLLILPRNQLKKSSIDVSLYSAWLNNTWTFKQTSMDQVIALT